MCTCNRCTFCLCQNFLNSELLQTVRAKLYAVVLRRSFFLFLPFYKSLNLWLPLWFVTIVTPSLFHIFLFSIFLIANVFFYIIEMYFIWCFCSLLISISRCSIISCYTSFFLLFDAVRVLKMCPFSLQTILVSSFFSALFGITCYLPVLDLKAYTLHYFELIVIVIRSVETSLLLPSVLMSLWLSCLI